MKDNEIIIAGKIHDPHNVYFMNFKKDLLDSHKKNGGRPCILIQTTPIGEYYDNKTGFIAIPFTKSNTGFLKVPDFVVPISLDVDSYMEVYNHRSVDITTADINIWYNKDIKQQHRLTTKELVDVLSTLEEYYREVAIMTLERFQQKPRSVELLENLSNKIDNLEKSNEELKVQNQELNKKIDILQKSTNKKKRRDYER